jgi:hypothetical protein
MIVNFLKYYLKIFCQGKNGFYIHPLEIKLLFYWLCRVTFGCPWAMRGSAEHLFEVVGSE